MIRLLEINVKLSNISKLPSHLKAFNPNGQFTKFNKNCLCVYSFSTLVTHYPLLFFYFPTNFDNTNLGLDNQSPVNKKLFSLTTYCLENKPFSFKRMTSPYNTAIVYVRGRPIKLFGKGVNNNRKEGYHSSRVQLKPSLTKGEQYKDATPNILGVGVSSCTKTFFLHPLCEWMALSLKFHQEKFG